MNLKELILTSLIQINLKTKIEQLSNTYLNGSLNTGLLTNDHRFWETMRYPFPAVRANLYRQIKFNLTLSSFIIDIRHQNMDEKLLRPYHRNSQTKIVVLIKKKNLREVRKSFLTIGICHVLILVKSSMHIKPYPLIDGCQGIGKLPNKTFKCKSNITVANFPPISFLSDGKLSGYAGLMVEALAHHMGIDLGYIDIGTTIGSFFPPSGLLGNISTKSSIMAIGPLFLYENRAIHADFIFGCSTINVGWVAPTGAGPSTPTWYKILVSEFSHTIWLCTLLVYVLLIPISMLFDLKLKTNVNWPLYNMGLFLGIPQNLVQNRLLTISIVFFGFFLTSHYTTVMSTKLTAPGPISQLTTQKQLLESGLRLVGLPSTGQVISLQADAFPNDKVKQDLKKAFEPIATDLDDMLADIARNQDFAFLREIENVLYEVDKNPIIKENIHIVEEKNDIFAPVALLPKHSCLTPKLQEGYYRLCDSGLVSKWASELTQEHQQDQQRGPRQLAFEHIQGFLILLVCGLTLATAAFVAELTVFHFTMKQRLRPWKKKLIWTDQVP